MSAAAWSPPGGPIPLAHILVAPGRRPLRDLEPLAESIATVGLLNPITVTLEGPGRYRLVAGLHRLEACRSLGWTEIPATVASLDRLHATLAEIDENLIRHELTALEHAEQLARRKEIYEALHPTTKHGGDRRSAGAISNGQSGHLKRFTADTEEKTGVSERTIRREIQIAKDIPDEIRDAIRDMPLADSKTDLLDLAKLDPEEQREVVDEILKAPPSRKSEARQVKQVVKRIRESRKAVALEEAPEAIVQDTDSWEIRHGDCLEVLPTIARGSVRLAFADPPYNIGVDYGEGHDDEMSPGDFRAWTVRWIRELAATLTPDGSMWVLINHEWGKDVETAICEAGLTMRDWITWYETFGVNCTNKFNRTSRRLFHAVKDPKRFVFHREAVTRPSDRQAIYNDRRANPKGKIWDDVWGIKPPIPRLVGNAVERIPGFPTQLPLDLLKPIVACASDRGDLVLDPFNGSGTAGVAAIGSGRRYLGIERSQTFLQRSRQRLLSTQRSFFDV